MMGAVVVVVVVDGDRSCGPAARPAAAAASVIARQLIDGLADAVITSPAKTVQTLERQCAQLMTVDRGGGCVLSRRGDSQQRQR